MNLNFCNKDNHLWNDMISVLSTNFALVSAIQTECWCKLNYKTQPETNKGLCEAKQNKVMPAMQ